MDLSARTALISRRRPAQAPRSLGGLLRDNGLSLVLGVAFAVLLAAQSIAGHLSLNEERAEHRQPALSYAEYLTSSHFAEATFENWESEFLQMAAYVLLTVFLIQRGSAESNDPTGASERPSSPRGAVPWPVRRGGWIARIYAHSLSLAFAALFAMSFALHAFSGTALHNEEQRQHQMPGVGVLEYVCSAQFWFESCQNWQSEFLAILCMVVFSIYLREKGSPESKDVDAPHAQTGS
ncbi:MAG: DUF6766 family protein [Candidatus Binatia bacterium]